MKKAFKAYLYLCDSHAIGDIVREISEEERNALESLGSIVSHSTYCWIRGCQNKASKVRLVQIVKTVD